MIATRRRSFAPVNYEPLWSALSDRAIMRRKCGISWHPELSTWDRIRVVLEPEWITSKELAAKIGRDIKLVRNALAINSKLLKFRHRKGVVGKVREYRLR
jgi:hypothetical protein